MVPGEANNSVILIKDRQERGKGTKREEKMSLPSNLIFCQTDGLQHNNRDN